MSLYVNNAGSQVKVKDAWINNGGTWTRLKVIYTNEGGTWVKSFSPEVRVDYLVVGGGGSGGGGRPDASGGGGGGGGGGGIFSSFTTVEPTDFSVSVSIGAGALSPGGSTRGINGGNSVLTGSISALAGGGYGGGPGNASPGQQEFGGAGGLPNGNDFQYSANGTFNGIGAGSGGRGRDDTAGRLGGAGFVWPINKTTYSGGGGGGGDGGGGTPTRYEGGAGGGGKGGEYTQLGYVATFYGGGGGGGGGNNGSTDPNSGGVGYSGVAIFSYVWPTQLFYGGTVTSETTNGVTRWFHTFFNNGTFVGV